MGNQTNPSEAEARHSAVAQDEIKNPCAHSGGGPALAGAGDVATQLMQMGDFLALAQGIAHVGGVGQGQVVQQGGVDVQREGTIATRASNERFVELVKSAGDSAVSRSGEDLASFDATLAAGPGGREQMAHLTSTLLAEQPLSIDRAVVLTDQQSDLSQ